MLANSSNRSRTMLGISQNTVMVHEDSTANLEYPVTFTVELDGNQTLKVDSLFTYNPSTDTLTVGHITGVVSQNEVSPVVDDIAYHLIGTADDPSAGSIDTTLNAGVNLSYTRKSSGENQLAVRSGDSQLCLFKTPTHPTDHGYKLRYTSSPSEFTIVQTTGGVDEVIMTISASGDVSFANDLTIGGVF